MARQPITIPAISCSRRIGCIVSLREAIRSQKEQGVLNTDLKRGHEEEWLTIYSNIILFLFYYSKALPQVAVNCDAASRRARTFDQMRRYNPTERPLLHAISSRS